MVVGCVVVALSVGRAGVFCIGGAGEVPVPAGWVVRWVGGWAAEAAAVARPNVLLMVSGRQGQPIRSMIEKGTI